MEADKLIEKVMKLTREKGVNQSELSRQIQVHPSRFSEWKSGNSRPSLTQVVSMARVLGVSVDYLVKDEVENQTNDSGLSSDEEAVITLFRALKLSLNEALRRLATSPAAPQPVGPSNSIQAAAKAHSSRPAEIESPSEISQEERYKPGCVFKFEHFFLIGIDEVPEGSVVCKRDQLIPESQAKPGAEYPIEGDFELYSPPPGSMPAIINRLIPQGLTFTPTFGCIILVKSDIIITEHDGMECNVGGPMIYAVVFEKGRGPGDQKKRSSK
ncbi:Transcriptional regulator, contains XRE-family HTH domain [Singulisphaera sp. GP187]|uniref:helix-turn-helix domain-containing protein n=1 Tax=Singulisphaera sp. GP187 TaxID=1882752 RepID=UPI0009264DE5|nr:helix-turn-helix transcriptional regulator [Singulisphaera sp. GP187]SIN97791.1 Transcriptional regulator, contains XRE-family HTH domain [Singulisphaera sp. GP187]